MTDMAAMQEIHDYLDECAEKFGAFYLTTVDGDKPACRPVSFHMILEGVEYFGVGTFKDVYKQIEANHNVQIVGCKGGEWIRISGTAVFDDDPALMEKALEIMPFLRNIYNEETGYKMGIFHLENASAQFIEKMMSVAKVVKF